MNGGMKSPSRKPIAAVTKGKKYPCIVEQKGKSPPQYPDCDDEDEEDDSDDEE